MKCKGGKAGRKVRGTRIHCNIGSRFVFQRFRNFFYAGQAELPSNQVRRAEHFHGFSQPRGVGHGDSEAEPGLRAGFIRLCGSIHVSFRTSSAVSIEEAQPLQDVTDEASFFHLVHLFFSGFRGVTHHPNGRYNETNKTFFIADLLISIFLCIS